MTEEEEAQQAEFSQQLRDIMKKRGIDTGDLAKRLRVSFAIASGIVEAPMKCPMLITMMLCDVLNIKITGGAGGTKIEDLEE